MAIVRNQKRIDQLVGPLPYSVVKSILIPNPEDLGEPQASNNPANPVAVEVCAGDQQVSIGDPGNWEGTESQLDTSLEILLHAPRTPDTS